MQIRKYFLKTCKKCKNAKKAGVCPKNTYHTYITYEKNLIKHLIKTFDKN